jgi:phosphopentomutase
MDGVGIGALPDAGKYGDAGSHTLRHIAERVGGLKLPTLEKLGLGAISKIPGVGIPKKLDGSYGKMNEVSPGKDTSTGHWEIAGIHLKKAFPTFPNGFPKKLIDAFIRETAIVGILGNRAASGTEIIKELGEEHLKTKYPIVYTSADSVFQVACHEKIFPLEELYRMCEIARKLSDAYGIGRVIARPFAGETPQTFQRTAYRKDYVLKLPEPTVLNALFDSSIAVIGIGKIEDIYDGQGISRARKTKSNSEGMEATLEEFKKLKKGLVFANLVDFDMLYGHRNDVEGFARAFLEFDKELPALMKAAKDDGMVIITADHGNDPTHPGTDHTREYVPLLVYAAGGKSTDLKIRETFSDVGQTLAEIFHLKPLKHGKSFLKELFS